MLIVYPALMLVKVVMEVVVDSGWMVFPPIPPRVQTHVDPALPRVLVHHPR